MNDTTGVIKRERRVRAKWMGGTKVELRSRNLPPWYADEPKSAGGTDEGPTPREMALGALAACVTVITHKVAEEIGFRYTDQSIEVRGTADPRGSQNPDNNISPNFEHVEVRISLTTDEPEDRVEELKRQHAGRCPISALFRESGCEFTEAWTIARG